MHSAWCAGEIKGDPDVAGVGVVVAIWTSSALAITAGTFLWYLQIFHNATTTNSRLYRIALNCAYLLGDTAMVTALAIISSSTILIKRSEEVSLYHIHIARCLTSNAFSGLGAAIFYDTRMRPNWQVRMGLVTLTIAFHIYWTHLGIMEFQEWTRETPKCFYDDSRVPFWYTDWMYLDMFWTPASWLWYWLEILPFSNLQMLLDRFNAFIPDLLMLPSRFAAQLHDAWSNTNHTRARNLSKGQRVKVVVGTGCLGVIELIARTLAAIPLLLFLCPPSTAPVTSLIYWLWSIYDLKMVWSANKHIVVECPAMIPGLSLQGHSNPENDWGFGQLLPMFLLLLPLLNFADAVVNEYY